MSLRAFEAVNLRGSQLVLCMVLAFLAPPVCAAQGDLHRAQEMLQSLDAERAAAATTTASSKFTQDYLDKRLATIAAEVNIGLLSSLNAQPPPACGDVEEELRSALGYGGRPDPRVAGVVCTRWNGSVYFVIGYELAGAITYSRSWIGVFAPSASGGRYQLLAAAENSLPSRTLALLPLPLPIKGKLSFLAYGTNWGDPHNRLTVIAYSLRESKLEPIWSRSDLSQGELKIEGGRIKLTFLSSPLGPGYKSVHEIAEAYEVTSSGIKLREHSEGPRP